MTLDYWPLKWRDELEVWQLLEMLDDEIAVDGGVHLELETLEILEQMWVVADDLSNLLQKAFWVWDVLRLEGIEN